MNWSIWKKTLQAIPLMTVLCLFLAGCSSPPSTSEGEQALKSRINEESQGRIQLIKFEKVNGLQGEVTGSKIYDLEFTAEVEFNAECKWSMDDTLTPPDFRTIDIGNTKLLGLRMAKGQHATLPGTIRLVKKEKGWAIEKLQLGKAKIGDDPDQSKDPKVLASQGCINNLKIIGIGFKLWAGDHDNRFPFNVSTNQGSILGGTMELSSQDAEGYDQNAHLIFRCLGPDLGQAKILICPADTEKQVAGDLPHLLPANLSYKVRSGKNVTEARGDEILVRCPLHGHTLQCDGSVHAGTSISAK